MKFRILFLILIMILPLMAQQVDRNRIIRSGKYYYGQGVAETMDEARDQALSELTSQIAVRVASTFQRNLKETSDQKLEESVESILKTHSTATLHNVKIDAQPTADGLISVFCYLEKSEVAKIFEERKKLIAEIAEKAQRFADNDNYAFALKYYYFATILLKSLPDENVVYDGVNYTNELPVRINQLINSVRFEFLEDEYISDKEREITLRVTANGRPVALLDFFFWDGTHQVAVQARDGMATLTLLGPSVSFTQLRLNIKYSYYEARSEYKAIDDLWKLVNRPTFTSLKTVQLKKVNRRTAPTALSLQKQKTAVKNYKMTFSGTVPVKETIMTETRRFIDVLSSGDLNRVDREYGADSFLRKKIRDYMRYNHPRVLDKEIKAKISKTRNGYELRRIRMLHKYPSIHKEATEYLVLDFNKDGKLYDLNLSITENLYDRFVTQAAYGSDWGNRQEIIKFIEKYRTAYLTRDIKTVDLMFAEDALILVGRKIKRKKLPDNMIDYHKVGKQPDFEYLKLSKKEYLKRQKAVFASQQDIFLDFGTFDIVKKNNSKNVYGVEMRQSYNSTTYSDQGYLFLLIDFNEKDPLIYVRAWQPKAWDEDELVRTANFRIYK